MKRTKFLALCFNVFSMSAVAGYECELKLAHMEDFQTTIATRTVQVGKNKMESGNMGMLFMESENRRRRISLDINAMMNGWEGEEDAAFVILRRTRKKSSADAVRLSEVVMLEGNQKTTAWFDAYKVDIECKLK
jgi:hypothetical protein